MTAFARTEQSRKRFASARCQSCGWDTGNRSDAKHLMHKHLARFKGHTVNLVALRVETWGVKAP